MTRKIISLFTGAGGLDLGFEAAGFNTAVAVEMDPDAVATLRANRQFPVMPSDIHTIKSRELMRAAEVREGEAELLVGGPPCQPFSKSGYWASGDAGRLDDPRSTTLEAYLRVLRDTKPKAFLLENVPGLAYARKSEGFDLLRTTIESINRRSGTHYSFTWKVLNAAEYGVPQVRERLFIVGHREGKEFRFPAPTHAESPAGGRAGSLLPIDGLEREPFLTAWDAIGDLDESDDDPTLRMTGKWANLLPSIPEGQNYIHHTDRGDGEPLFGWRRRYWSFLLKLSKRLPAWTITAQPGSAIGPFHWKSRRLSMRELSRIQTFPDEFNVLGSRLAYQRQIGNAVPSALAEILGLEIRRQLLGEPLRGRSPRLLPRRRLPVPRAEPTARVPRKYLELVGDHAPHPGTGRGYGAVARRARSA